MPRDMLEIILRTRRVALDEARRDLGVALNAEEQARIRLKCIESEIASERQQAMSLDASDAVVEAFGAWLLYGRERERSIRETADMAAAESARARAVVTAARKGLEAASKQAERKAIENRSDEMRREQLALEDAARKSRAAT